MNVDMNIEEIQTEARNTFDMRARLAGATRRSKQVTIYTDEVAGAELGGVQDEMVGEYKTGRKIRTGLIGQLDQIREDAERETALLDSDDEDYEEQAAEITARLKASSEEVLEKVNALRERMAKTSMTFTLHALPDIIVRDMRRKTRAALDIKTKNIPDDLEEEYGLEYTAQMLAASVASWVDNQTGQTHGGLTVEQAKDLRDLLPVGQFSRLDRAMVELSIEVAISNQATDSADF